MARTKSWLAKVMEAVLAAAAMAVVMVFFFFFVPQLYLWGSPFLGEISAYVTFF